jgi:hypothetical protein
MKNRGQKPEIESQRLEVGLAVSGIRHPKK